MIFLDFEKEHEIGVGVGFKYNKLNKNEILINKKIEEMNYKVGETVLLLINTFYIFTPLMEYCST